MLPRLRGDTLNGPRIRVAAFVLIALAAAARDASAQTGSIAGVVTNALTGAPVAGVRIDVSGYGTGTDATTDAAGRYQIDIAPGSYLLYAWSSDFVSELFDNIPCRISCSTTGATTITVTAGATVTANFALQPLAVVTGTLTNTATGAPLASGSSTSYGHGV